MNTQQQMMQILQATNAYYTSPIERGWEPSKMTEIVFARHNDTGMNYFFKLDPETKVIKIESFDLDQPNKITIYTGTITLGGRLIAPDMILALDTLFNFDFASDATFVVENNRARKIVLKRKISSSRAASDATDPASRSSVFSRNTSLNRHSSSLLSVSSSRKVSKVLRFFIYFESPFRR